MLSCNSSTRALRKEALELPDWRNLCLASFLRGVRAIYKMHRLVIHKVAPSLLKGVGDGGKTVAPGLTQQHEQGCSQGLSPKRSIPRGLMLSAAHTESTSSKRSTVTESCSIAPSTSGLAVKVDPAYPASRAHPPQPADWKPAYQGNAPPFALHSRRYQDRDSWP